MTLRHRVLLLLLVVVGCSGYGAVGQPVATAPGQDLARYRLVYKGNKGPGLGRNIVFITSDHEYRSEESLPALARILAKRYGFTCTVLFGLDEQGHIRPGSSDLRGLAALQNADLMVLFTRFSHLPDEEMQHFDDYIRRGGPIVAFRTATHAFSNKGNTRWEHYHYEYDGPKKAWKGGFGEYVLGETWVGHYGTNHKQASRLIVEEAQAEHPILRGVQNAWAQSGGYKAYPNGTPLVRGQVLYGMTPDAAPDTTKELLPVAWVRTYSVESGPGGRVFVTTHGASEDLLNEGFRRMALNGMLWALGMESHIKATNNIELVGPYQPTTFNFNGYKASVKPADLQGWDSVIMPGQVVKKQ
jgi:type 1 glutamine amidotransferase